MFRFALVPCLTAVALLVCLPIAADSAKTVFPGRDWDVSQDRSSVRRARADELTTTLRAGDTSAMLVVMGGRVVLSYGDVTEVSYIASARKSVVAMLYGKYVASGAVRLDSTLRELDLDDKGGLLPSEREATVGDLLAARSGVYHPAANQGDATSRAPARGSVTHGRYFLYNNWDFNALETILERRTGRSIYELFSDDLALPLRLQDWNPAPGAYAGAIRNDTGASDFPAHHLVLSTRDMARLGYLMLRQGRWENQQVMPADWARRIAVVRTSSDEVMRTSPFVAGLAYGNLWWILDGPPFSKTALHGAYTASGAYGQFITVIPRLDMVVAHKTLAPSSRNVPADVYFARILPQVLALSAH